jgi:2'-5' RNA ligase
MGAPNTVAPAGDDDRRKKIHRKFSKNPTGSYHPSGAGWYGFGAAALDGAPVFTWLDVPRMLRDPQVRFIERLWRAPFQKVRWKVKAATEGIANFVSNTLRRFWRQSLPRLLSKYWRFGYCAGGAEFVEDRNWLRLRRVRAVEPRDAYPRVWTGGQNVGQFAGFELQSTGNSRFVGSPHAMWFAGFQEYSEYYDMAPLSGLFEPWLEKRGRNGAVHARRLWFRRGAWRGKKLYHPPGETNVGSDESPQLRDNQDIAREILEYADAGGTFTFENTVNPASEGGKYEWDLEDDKPQGDIAGFRDYPRDLDLEMLDGAGIPREVVQSSESGSGYNGRLLPYQGFLGTVDEVSGLVVESCEPWLNPLTQANFGPAAWYEIELVSLADEAEKEQEQKQKRSGELPAKPGMGGDLPFTLSTLDYRLMRRGWKMTSRGDFIRGDKPRSQKKTFAPLSLSTTDAKPHKFSSTHIILPPGLAEQLREMAAKIPDSALADDGREDEFHVTVRYGLHADSPEPVAEILKDSPPVRAVLGRVSVFKGADCGKDYDVLKVDVVSPDLARLNRELAALPHTDKFKDYNPHATIAYVKAGMGDAFAALAQPLDAEFTAKNIVFSSRSGSKTDIPLAEPRQLSATVTPEDDPEVTGQAFEQTTGKLMRSRKATLAQLLALAMVRVQQRATAAGKPDAAAGSLAALSEMAGAPVQVAKVVGMREMSTLEAEYFELAWSPFTTARNTVGAVNSETGKKLYGKAAQAALASHQRTQDRATAEKESKEIIDRVAKGKGTLEDIQNLSRHLPALRNETLLAYRTKVEANLRGERKKQWMVQRLLDHVAKTAGQKDAVPREQRLPDEAKGSSRNKSKSKLAGTVTQSVIDWGGLDPDSHELKAVIGSARDAVEHGVPLAAFRSKDGKGKRGLKQLAQDMANAGHITIPEGVRPGEYLLEQMIRGTKVHGSEGMDDREYERAMRERYGEEEVPQKHPSHEQGEPITWEDEKPAEVAGGSDPVEEKPESVVAPKAEAAPEVKAEAEEPPLRLEDVAKLVQVAPRTVAKWFDAGRIKGTREEGTGNRLVTRAALDTFLAEHGMPPVGGEPTPAPEAKTDAAKAEEAKAETPAPVKEEIAKEVAKPAPQPTKKRAKNTPVNVPEAEAKALQAAVAYNAVVQGAQDGASPEQLTKLHDRAKAAAGLVPEAKRAAFLQHLDLAAKGKGKLLDLPKGDESEYEGVQPEDDVPEEPVAEAPAPEAESALPARAEDDDEPVSGRPKDILEGKVFDAHQKWQEAVAKKRPAKTVAQLRKSLEGLASSLPEEKRQEYVGTSKGAKKAASALLADPEMQKLLESRRPKAPAPTAENLPAPVEAAKTKDNPPREPKKPPKGKPAPLSAFPGSTDHARKVTQSLVAAYQSAATPGAKEALARVLTNVGVDDPDVLPHAGEPGGPPLKATKGDSIEAQRDAARELALAWEDADPADRPHLEAIAKRLGLTKVTTAPGGFDASRHQSGGGMNPGDPVEVETPGWSHANAQGENVFVKPRVRGATSPASKPAPVPEAKLAKDPGADKARLQHLAQTAPSEAAREAILDAEHNVPAGDSAQDYTPAERRRYTLDRLAAAWRNNHLAGNAEGAEYLAGVLKQFGAELHGPEAGQVMPFDSKLYDSEHSVMSGPVKVIHKPVVARDKDGGVYIAAKGKVGPATPPSPGSSAQAATKPGAAAKPLHEYTGGESLSAPQPTTHQELADARDSLDADREAGRLVNQMSTRSGPDRLTYAANMLKERERFGPEKTQIDPAIAKQILTSYVPDSAQKGYRQTYLNAVSAMHDAMTPAEKQGFVDAWASDLGDYADFISGRQKPHAPSGGTPLTSQQAADGAIGKEARQFLLDRHGDDLVELPFRPGRKRGAKVRVRDLLTTGEMKS